MMGISAPLRVDALLILTRTDCSRFVFSGTQEMKLTIVRKLCPHKIHDWKGIKLLIDAAAEKRVYFPKLLYKCL